MKRLKQLFSLIFAALLCTTLSACFGFDESLTGSELPAASTFSIRYIDVGQADAALVECDGHYMLIDGGNRGDSSLIYSVLQSESVRKLDIIVATHAHEDHVGGLAGALNYATAALALCPVASYDSTAFENFKTYAEANGGGITIPEVGDTYTLGSATIEILGVNEGASGESEEGAEDGEDAEDDGSATNNSSVVLKITYGNTTFLFTGDAEYDEEMAILERGTDVSATVLKVSHHGATDGNPWKFLEAVSPEYAIISVGEDNDYGHPSQKTLSRLEELGAQIYRTDVQGDIYLTSDGQTVTITTEKTATEEELMTPGTQASSEE